MQLKVFAPVLLPNPGYKPCLIISNLSILGLEQIMINCMLRFSTQNFKSQSLR